jgi:hypothetical protein
VLALGRGRKEGESRGTSAQGCRMVNSEFRGLFAVL